MKDILQYTGLISSFLLLCGVLKFYLYYKRFNISILRFIDLSEILTLFMDNIIAYLAIIIPITINLFLIYVKVKSEIPNISNSIWHITFSQWPLILFFFFISTIGIIIYFFKSKGVRQRDFKYLILLIVISILTLPFLFIYSLRIMHIYFHIQIEFTYVYLTFLSVLLLGYTLLTVQNEIHKVINDGFYDGVKLVFENDFTIESNRLVYFIGMTKNYVFVYEKASNACTAYKVNNLRTIKFR